MTTPIFCIYVDPTNGPSPAMAYPNGAGTLADVVVCAPASGGTQINTYDSVPILAITNAGPSCAELSSLDKLYLYYPDHTDVTNVVMTWQYGGSAGSRNLQETANAGNTHTSVPDTTFSNVGAFYLPVPLA